MEWASRSQGVHGQGSRTYKAADYQRVVQALRRLPEGRVVTVVELSQMSGVAGRAVRNIISDADGVDLLLGGDGNGGYQLARSAGEAERLTLRLASQANRMSQRVRRRSDMARGLFKEADNVQLPLV